MLLLLFIGGGDEDVWQTERELIMAENGFRIQSPQVLNVYESLKFL